MVQNSWQLLLEKALEWLKDNYESFRFFDERDVVWTLQTHMIREAETLELPLKIYDNHTMAFGKQVDLNMDKQTPMFREDETRKSPLKAKRQVNLAVLNMDDSADTVIEIKYEPDHNRAGLDISAGKLVPSPRTTWASVIHDIRRVRTFVAQGVAKNGFCIFIDEGSHFLSHKYLPEGSKWVYWGRSPYSEASINVLTTAVDVFKKAGSLGYRPPTG